MKAKLLCIVPWLVLPVVAIGVYANTIDHSFQYDDAWNIRVNPNVRLHTLNMPSLRRAAFLHTRSRNRPLSNLGFALSHYFGGMAPRSFRVVSFAFHALNSWLIYALLCWCIRRRQTRTGREGPVRPWAFLLTLVWAVHPLHTSAVIYIHQRMVLQSTFFMLLAIFAYIWMRGRLEAAEELEGEATLRRWWRLSRVARVPFSALLLAFCAATLSKELGLLLILILPVFEWAFYHDFSRRWLKRHWWKFGLAFTALSGVGLTVLMLKGAFWLTGMENRPDVLVLRLVTECRVLLYYLWMAVFPHPAQFNIDHGYPLSRDLFTPWYALPGVLVPLGLLAIAVWSGWRKAVLASFGVVLFLIMMSMEAAIFALDVIAEYRMYFASVGVLLVLAEVLNRLGRRGKAVAAVGLVLFSIVCAHWTRVRGRDWKSPLTLWSDAVEKQPTSFRTNFNKGIALMRLNRYREALPCLIAAIAHGTPWYGLQAVANCLHAVGHEDIANEVLLKAMEIGSHSPRGRLRLAESMILQGQVDLAYSLVLPDSLEMPSRMTLGRLDLMRGNIERAFYWLRSGIEMQPEYDGLRTVHGQALATVGRFDEALAEFAAAERMTDQLPEFYQQKAEVLLAAGQAEPARALLEKLLREAPDDPKLLFLLAEACTVLGDREAATDYLQRAGAYEYFGGEAWRAWGEQAARAGDFAEAVRCFRQCVELSPSTPARVQLAAALIKTGQRPEAEQLLDQVVAEAPWFAEARKLLGVILAQSGRYAEALPHFEAALSSSPDSRELRQSIAICRRRIAEEQSGGPSPDSRP